VNAFYEQYDDFVVNYNEKFAKPGQKIMAALRDQKLITATQFDEEIEWSWFYLWHHEGRRARHGASMMAPDYAHWHGMYEVAERFYQELVPQARELADHAEEHGNAAGAAAVRKAIDAILARPEHAWFEAEKHKDVSRAADDSKDAAQPPADARDEGDSTADDEQADDEQADGASADGAGAVEPAEDDPTTDTGSDDDE
jgi:hypothetical protein